MGKFGDNYYKYNYSIIGNVYKKILPQKEGYTRLTNGKINPNANLEFVQSLRPLL